MHDHPVVITLCRLALAACVLVAPGISPEPAGASDAPAEPRPSAAAASRAAARFELRPDSLSLSTGTRELGYAMGIGFGTPVLGSHTSDNLALGSLRLGWVLNRQWEVLCDVWAGQRVTSGARSLAGFTPMARYRFPASGRWMPFLSIGSGPSYADLRGVDLGTLFEFNTQVGGGAYYFLRDDTAITLEYRWLHLSNAGIKAPNGGMNTQMVFVGVARFY